MSFERSQADQVFLALKAETPAGDVTLVSPAQTTVDATGVTSATLVITNPSTSKTLNGMALFIFPEVRAEIDTVAFRFQVEGRAYLNGVLQNDQANHNYPVEKVGATTQALINVDYNAPAFPLPITLPPGGTATLLLRMDYNWQSGTPRDVTIQKGYIAFWGAAL